MDHNEAIRLQAVEKYVLGEFSADVQEQFEEHFFDCAECADDIKAVTLFVDNTREVWRREASNLAQDAPLGARVPEKAGWFAWLKPMVAVPAFAVLFLALGYQSFVAVPYWKHVAARANAPRVLLPGSLIAANTRGTESPVFRVRPDETLGLYFDVPADPVYSTYLLRLEDPTGSSRVLRSVSYAEAQKTMVVEVTPGTLAGNYQIVVLGFANSESNPPQAATLATLKFSVALVP